MAIPSEPHSNPMGNGTTGLEWTRRCAKLRELVPLEIRAVGTEPEPRVPVDLRAALAEPPGARAVWSDITRIARKDRIQWITSAKQSETGARRISNACEMLAAGKRRVCCFDRSGI